MRRKPNVEQRRRDLCDVAIELLAAGGARGVTHLRVDRHAGLADGTTSFYYQKRAALLRGAIDRVIELDVADFTEALNATSQGEVDSLLSRLAEQAIRTAVEPERARARARFELMMIASRDAELGAVFDSLTAQFVTISEAAVAQVRASNSSAAAWNCSSPTGGVRRPLRAGDTAPAYPPGPLGHLSNEPASTRICCPVM